MCVLNPVSHTVVIFNNSYQVLAFMVTEATLA